MDYHDVPGERAKPLIEGISSGKRRFEFAAVEDGAKLFFDARVSDIEEQNETRGTLLIFSDITERRQAEQGVEYLNSLLRAITDVNQLIIQERDLQTLMQRACEILQQSRDYVSVEIALLMGDSDGTIRSVASSGVSNLQEWVITLDGEGNAYNCIHQCLQTGQSVAIKDPDSFCSGCDRFEADSTHKAIIVPIMQSERLGGFLFVRLQPEHELLAREIALLEEVAGDLGFAREKYEAEERLASERRLVDALLRNTPDNIYFKDRDSRFIRVNPVMASYLGVEDPAQLVGKTDFDFFTQEHAEQAYADEQRIIETGETLVKEEKETWPDGRETWVSTVKGPLMSGDGEIVGTFGLSRDITERKQAEEREQRLREQLERSRRLESVGQLGGGVAHHLNNLLTPIIGNLELASFEMDSEQKQHIGLDEALQAANEARDLVSHLLAFSQQRSPEMQVVSLNDVVTDMQPLLRATLREDVQVEVELAPDLGLVRADTGQIQEAIMNMAANSQDAMPQGGIFHIATANQVVDGDFTDARADLEPGRYVLLTISDTGIGMDQETQEHLFEPFFTTKELGKGVGLGLATVHGIVTRHAGRISVYSEVGQGTTFRIYLPCIDQGKARQQPEEDVAWAQMEELGSFRILLVEDNDLVRSLAERILRADKHLVFSAAGPEQALEIARGEGEPVDLLVTDVIMPGMHGPELYTQLTQLWPGLLVLYMSGYPGPLAEEGMLARQEAAFLQKPFSPDELREAVHKLLWGS